MKNVLTSIGYFLGYSVKWFISALFLYLGYSVLVKRFGLPYFSYWEIFFMRMALANLFSILWQKSNTQVKVGIEND